MSTEATPEPGKPRRFTAADLKLIAFVYQQTSTGNQTHDQVLESLAAGALEVRVAGNRSKRHERR